MDKSEEALRGRPVEEEGATKVGEKLLTFIRDNYKTIPVFCEAHGLVRQKVVKAIRGEIKRIDGEFMFDIERATGGHVRAQEWLPMHGDTSMREAEPPSAAE
jgi:hypothetical protein